MIEKLSSIAATHRIVETMLPCVEDEEFHPLSADFVSDTAHLSYSSSLEPENVMAKLFNKNVPITDNKKNSLSFKVGGNTVTIHFRKAA